MKLGPRQGFGARRDDGVSQLIVMARSGRSGQAKTRLAREVGAELAAAFQQVCLSTIVQRLMHAADRRVLALWPPEDLLWGRTTAAPWGWRVIGQQAGDLGQKMSRQFTAAFASGSACVVMIGSDSPHLPPTVIGQAFAALQLSEFVIGPSQDGGYYLIGGRADLPEEVFVDIDWGTSHVFQQTCQRLQSLQCTYSVLPVDFDVDELRDISQLLEVLGSHDYRDDVWQPLRTVCQACIREAGR